TEHRALSLREVAQLTGYNKSAAQRFCHTLVKLGYLRRHPNNSDFELSVRTTEIGARFVQSNSLLRRAQPYLHQLCNKTCGAVTLSILEGAEVVFAARYLGADVLETNVTVGSRLPIYCTASGRAAASLLDDAALGRVLDAQDFAPRTAKTVVDRADIEALIHKCRTLGFALVSDQFAMTDLSLAVPLYDRETQTYAAITLALTTASHSEGEVVERFAALMQSTARAIAN
ncbi:MAG: IclR family transcriptional regulator domain-containing protein, partial [Pseudomonadales bacterium]